MGSNIIPHHQVEFMIKKGTAINAVKAQGKLTLTGAVKDGETIQIGNDIFEIDTDNVVVSGNIPVDVSSHAVPSKGKLTLSGVLKDGETFKIGEHTYEINSKESYTEGNIPVDVTEFSIPAKGTLELTGVVKDGETFKVGEETFEIDTNDSVGEGNIAIDVSSHATPADGLLTLTGTVIDGETFKIGDETYEIDTDGSVTEGNKAVDVSSSALASQGSLTLPVQPSIGDTFTIGTQEFTFVAELDANADGEVGIGADLAGAQANIIAAINGTDGFNTAHTSVTAGTFTNNVLVITAKKPGVAGDTIATTEVFTDPTNIFDGVTLGTTRAGVDCPAADADDAIILAINTNTTADIVASQGTGTTIVITHTVPGTVGNALATDPETLSHGSFGAVTLENGADCTAANADGEIVTQFNEKSTVPVTASQGTGTTIVFTADVPGDDGNSIATDPETLSNGAFDAATLGTTQAGVDCSAANGDGAIIEAINGNENAIVEASQGTGTSVIITAKTPGTAGDSIVTDPESLANGAFDAVTLGTEQAGVDCPAADADGIIITSYNAGATERVTASQGAGTTIIFESDLGGVIGNAISSETDISNGSFDDDTLGTEQLGVNGSIGQALIDDNFLYVSDEDNSVHGSDWKKIALTDL